MSFGVDFGQKVDLTASIRNILRNYPEGTAILKELVQNADDAGAKSISFCLDSRSHPSSKLAGQSLAQFQGPSLLVHNDAVFTENDFQSIQRIGDSLKKSDSQKSKIGRFGIGFNSVYHITDLPSFISSSFLVMLDPQAKYLPDVNPSNPGKMVDFVNNQEALTAFADQFAPYMAYGMQWSRPYQGTLFRLPLRTAQQAETSLLSKRCIGVADVTSLLQSLRMEASAMLLFLKSVERIEICRWTSHDQSGPDVLFSCCIANMTPTLERNRAFVGEAVKISNSKASRSIDGGQGDVARSSSTSKGQKPAASAPAADMAGTADYQLVVACAAGNERYDEVWEVCNQLGGGHCSVIAADPNNALLRLVPWGGVAAQVSSTEHCQSDVSVRTEGLAYCFLPLPVQTGLPVMVNGFFELSSNRRDVWQAGSDMEGDGRTRAEWNISLMRDIVSPSYMRLLLRLREPLGFSEKFQHMWPSARLLAPWSHVADSTLQLCRSQRLLRRDAPPNHHETFVHSIPAESKSEKRSMFSRKVEDRSPLLDPVSSVDSLWITCAQAVLLPGGRSDSLLSEEDVSVLRAVLVGAGQFIVTCTADLRSALVESKTCEVIATPAFTRESLRLKESSSRADSYMPPLSSCRMLMHYCLSDMDATNPSVAMDCLPILPMVDHTVGVLRIMSMQLRQSVSELTSMGFSETQARFALGKTNNDVMRACELLTTVTSSDDVTSEASSSVYVICGEEVSRVFRQASRILVDTSQMGGAESEFMGHKQMGQVSNVKPFSASLVPDLLRKILPVECFLNAPIYRKALGGSYDDIVLFLKNFWGYVVVHPELMAAAAEGAAIIPSRNGMLLPLSRLFDIIAPKRGDVEIPSNILDILELLGASILDDELLMSFSSMPQVFWDYVHSSSRKGILSLLDSLLRQKSKQAGFESLSPSQREELFMYIASAESTSSLTGKDADVIRQLPIFKVSNGSYFITLANSKTKYCALRNAERLSPELYPSNYLSYQTPQELQLLVYVGVAVVNRSQYFASEFLPNAEKMYTMMPELVQKDLIEMMVEVMTLIEEDKKFGVALREFKYVPAGVLDSKNESKGESSNTVTTLHRPSELFDPNETELCSLLDETFFPSPEFQREDILVHLRTAGLQSTLDWTGVIACARSIEEMPSSASERPDSAITTNPAEYENLTDRQRRGSCLLQYLTKNMSRLMGEERKSEQKRPSIFSLRGLFGSEKPAIDTSSIDNNVAQLVSIAWLPVYRSPLHTYMPWISDSLRSDVAPPNQTRPAADAWSCSSTHFLTLLPVHATSLVKAFQWNHPLPVKTIAKQLRDLAAKYIANKAAISGDISGEGESEAIEQLQNARETITALIPVLYQRLNNLDQEDYLVVTSTLGSQPWIWVGDTFVHPSRVAFSSAMSLVPYRYAIPQDLAVFRRLLELFGVKDTFNARDYVDVLNQMALERSKSNSGNALPLSDQEIDLAVSLVTLLSAEGGGGGGADSFRAMDHTIYVPDSTGRLFVSTDLVSDDVPWLNGAEYTSARSGVRLCHPHIASKVAQRVGVKSLRLMLVDRSVESFFSEAETHVEAFGQAESLTGRLRTILDMYPDGNPILSELIQNADDSGATIVKIMIDENSYAAESLMDVSAAPLQGPSLLLYNNSCFSESDFRSLARIGQGSKLEKLSATGRFGLGFNSVYHLTDTPSFVSGDYLVIFDPHTTFIPGTTIAQPGIRMKFAGNSLRDTFPDQFKPYEYFGCNFERAFQGTLFRFPLRTSTLARKSEISKRSYAISDVNMLLDQLTSQLAHHLLFLRSVTSIEVYRCRKGESEPILVQRAVASIDNISEHNEQTLLRYFDKKSAVANAVIPAADSSRDSFYSRLASTPDNKLPTKTYHVSVQTDVISESVGESKSAVGSVQQDSYSTTVEYMVVSGLRGGPAKAMACDPRTRHLKLVPLGAVAACISQRSSKHLQADDPLGADTNRSVDFPKIEGQAFCFLPLPVRTSLPVHVNAYFELSSNRRDIWRGDDTTGESKIRGQWNDRLMEDVIAPLYALLLTKISAQPGLGRSGTSKSELIASVDYRSTRKAKCGILSLLPCPAPPVPWNIVSNATLPLIKEAALLWSNMSGGLYLPVGASQLLQESATDSGQQKDDDSVNRLEHILIAENIPVVVVPAHVYRTLLDAKCVAGAVTPEFLRWHYRTMTTMGHPSLDNEWESRTSSCGSDASFILEYCMRDIPPVPYSELIGMQVVPMEMKGALGKIGDVTDAPLYLASDFERKLLQRVGQCIVASEAVLGPRVMNAFKSPSFLDQCNIRQLTPLDTLKLLKQVVPTSWFSHTVTLVNRTEDSQAAHVTPEWLHDLWGYILNTNSMQLFEDMFPLVPVMQPPNKPAGSYLAKILSNVPILHMSLKDSLQSPVALGCLSDLGLHIIDSAALGSLAYSDALHRIMCEPSPRGLLNAICSVQNQIAGVCVQWDAQTRDAFREVMLDNILVKLDSLSQKDIEVLSSFPVFKRHGDCDKTNPVGAYFTLHDESFSAQIPPRNVQNESLLDSQFVVLRNDRDRALYAMLGLQEPSGGDFYSINVIPNIARGGVYSDEMIDKLSVELLKSQVSLERERPGTVDLLRKCPFVRSAGGALCCPDLLFDPHAPYISSLLPPDAFPSAELYQADGALLASLRTIGLSTSISCSGIMRAAEAIHRDFMENRLTADEDNMIADGLTDVEEVIRNGLKDKNDVMQKAIQRASNLLKYLDSNIETLLEEVVLENESSSSASPDAFLKSTWVMRLRDLVWIPVFTEPPQNCNIATFLPPWPQTIHRTQLAKPVHCLSLESIWECSTSYRISKSEIQSGTLQKVLGWDCPLSGRTVTQQLLALKEMFLEVTSSVEGSSTMFRHKADRVVELCYKVVSRIYSSLADALEREKDVESQIWIRSLRGRAVVWVGGSFIEANRISFTPLSSINTEPFLYVAKGELLSYRALLLQLGVKQEFGPGDLSSLLRDLHATCEGQALPPEKLDMCLGIIKIIVRLVDGEDVSTPVANAVISRPSPINAEDSDDESMESLDMEPIVAVEPSPEDIALMKQKVEDMKKELGLMYLPDRQCVLAPASSLAFDDAPWISAQLTSRGSGGMRFVHKSVDIKAAVLFGARSLREQLFSGDAMVCPSAGSVHDIIGEDDIADAVGDLVGLADSLGSRAVHLLYDDRTYPCESLMHPGLASMQGPALTMYLEGVILGSEELTQVLMSPVLLPELPSSLTSKTNGEGLGGAPDGSEVKFNSTGKRLNAAFAITDCLQVLSGSQFFVFDPCGQYLMGSHDDGKKKGSSRPSNVARAQQYPLVDRENQSVLSRFPDQFAPMLSISFNGTSSGSVYRDGRVAGTMLRMPLRKEPSALSCNIPSVQTIREIMRHNVERLEGSLIFSRSLLTCSLQHIEQNTESGSGNVEYYMLNLINGSQVQYIRKKVIGDRNWKKSGNLLTSFFKSQPTTAEASYRAFISHRHGQRGVLNIWFGDDDSESSAVAAREEIKGADSVDTPQDKTFQVEWAVHCLQGAEHSRDLALRDPFKKLDLMPFLSIAMPVLTPAAIEAYIKKKQFSKFNRYAYCNGDIMGGIATGLPFHVDGSFVLHMRERGISLPPLPARADDTRSSVTTAATGQLLPVTYLHQWNVALLVSCVEHVLPNLLTEMRDETVTMSSSDPSRMSELKTFYCHWPYLARMPKTTAFHLSKTNMLKILANKELFLGRKGFESLSSLTLPICAFPPATVFYLQSFMPFADIPPQIAKDFQSVKMSLDYLTPSKLRDLLRADGRVHCSRLNGRYEIVLPLLKHCISDMERDDSTSGEFARRKLYRELAGCPLLPMASEEVQCFPTNPRDQIVIAPTAMHAVMPMLRGIFMHPTALNGIDILSNNSLLKETLHIEDVSTQFIKDNATFFLPVTWQRCRAVEWSSIINKCGDNSAAGRGLAEHSNSSLRPSDLLIYVLWREVLSKTDELNLLVIANLPLLPVVAGTKRMLVTTSIAPLLLCTKGTTAQQEAQRGQLRREMGRLKSLVEREDEKVISRLKRNNEGNLLEALSQGIFTPEPLEATSSSHNAEGLDVAELEVELNGVHTSEVADETGEEIIADSFSSRQLGDTLLTLQMPVIDGGIFEDPPAVVAMASATRGAQPSKYPTSGHKILACLSHIHKENMMTHRVVLEHANEASIEQSLEESGLLLRFDLLTTAQRKCLLLEFLNAHAIRPLIESEIANLKSLPVFTTRDGKAIAVSDCSGVYWCDSDAALAGLSETYSGNVRASDGAAIPSPVVLIADNDLRPMYTLVGAEELTPATVVRKFTLPSLGLMEGSDRLRVMRGLASQWDSYRNDNELLQLLKAVAFVPAWHTSEDFEGTATESSEILDTHLPFRRPQDLFSWTNSELLTALQGPSQSEYFPPPSMRTYHWHVMLVDLGMSSELDKDSLLRVALDIQSAANALRLEENDGGVTKRGGPYDRGKGLLRYLRDSNRAATLLDMSIARRLGKVCFVPASIPVTVEAGGHVVYKADVVRFEQTLAGHRGALGFTVLPTLTEDITPPQSFSSSLGITTVPSIEIVLRHLRNLTSCGDTLDRWNTVQYPLKESFGEIFSFLFDNWKAIATPVKEALKITSIVPVGHILVKPARLFFRLSEDLSPFMHEIPRFFGTHEQLLKLLGVREKPSSSDYSKFLAELAFECSGTGLNPNELRAVIAIIQAVSVEHEAEGDVDGSYDPGMYLPDEDSVLRESIKCLYNDNGWLRERLGGTSFGNGQAMTYRRDIYVLHPLVVKQTAMQLRIPLLSDVLIESLVPHISLVPNSAVTLASEVFVKTLQSPEFITAMTALCLRTRTVTERNAEGDALQNREVSSRVQQILTRVRLRFVESFQTEMTILDPRSQGTEAQVTESMESLCFVSPTAESIEVIINVSMLKPPISSVVAIGIGLCRALHLDASLATTASLLLSSLHPADCQRVLTDLRVSSDGATLRESVRGSPGMPLSDMDKRMVELKPFRGYRVGEIVAYDSNELDTRSSVPAVNESELDALPKANLCYGKVVFVSEEGGALMKKITLRTGTGTITLLPTAIYSFKSARDPSLHSSRPAAGADQKRMPKLMGATRLSIQGGRSATVIDSSDSIGKECVENVDNSTVSKQEVLDAVSSLLHRAGVPLSMEKQDLVAKLLDLEAAKRKLEFDLASEKTMVAETQEAIDNLKSSYMCQICLGDRVDHVLIPCGHTMCGDCLGRMQTNRCPFCRSQFSHRTKFFLSSSNDDGSETKN